MRLLIIDDDELLADVISQHLIKQHYAVDIATTGKMGLEFIDLFDYDLIILDLMLPDLNGRQLCTRIRQNKHQMPILMLTAQDNAKDKVAGLDAGADDYLIKPIHFPELLARVRALLRRVTPIAAPQLQWGALQLDPNSFETTYDGELLTLTPKEYAILELFLRNPHKSHTLDGIIDGIWASESPPSLYAVRTHIKSVRHKLKDLGAPQDFIETIYGFGYRLNPEYAAAPLDNVTASLELPAPQEPIPPPSQISHMTQELWSKHKGEMEARIRVLETLVKAIREQSLTEDLRQHGVQVAHKLAGSLGCFSFHDGSQYARKIERCLSQPHPLTPSQGREIQALVKQLRASIDLAPQDDFTVPDLPDVLVYSNHPVFVQTLTDQMPSYGLAITSVRDEQDLLLKLETCAPRVVLLDLTNPEDSLSALAFLHERAPEIPAIAILHGGEWLDRIDFIQHGISRVFQAPANAHDVLEAIQQLVSSAYARAKILLVDDDRILLDSMNSRLRTLGFEIATLDNTLHFWPILKQTNPDVIVLDVEMPGVNGIELCQILRADPLWSDIPVIFLSSHKDPKTEDHAFEAGADDFISKSLPINRLALRIQNRLR